MPSALPQDLARLAAQAYDRLEWSGALVKSFHHLRRKAVAHPDFPLLARAQEWLLAPFTLWAIDLHGLCAVLQERVAQGQPLEPELRLLAGSLPPPPAAGVQAVAAEHEHDVRRGAYERQVRAGEKYALAERRLEREPEFRAAWAQIQATFPVATYRDAKGIIRRRLVMERAFRTEWNLAWDQPAARFQAVFDLFCQRWSLYGMAGDRPLLQRLTVNLTPHGTMIFIPAWWSLDPKRDLAWKEITRLHRVRAPGKQGPKLTRNQMAQADEARRAWEWNEQARRQGLRGAARVEWVLAKLRWHHADANKLRLVLRRARALEPGPSPGPAK